MLLSFFRGGGVVLYIYMSILSFFLTFFFVLLL